MNRANPSQFDRTRINHTRPTAADFLQLDRTAVAPGGLTGWLTGSLRDAISDGTLRPGTTLPASRTLAAELDVSRGVVTEAYRRLAEGGHVEGRGRAGTVVVGVGALGPSASDSPSRRLLGKPRAAGTAGAAGESLRPTHEPTEAPPVLATPVFATPGSAASFEALRATPARIDLSPGVPDLSTFPRAAWLRAERRVLADLPTASLAYGDPRGEPALRTAVADWLARFRGVRVDPEEVVVVAGVAQALALVARVLLDAGLGTVAVEEPGSLGSRQLLAAWGVVTPPVPVDEHGVRVDELRASGARVAMLTPAHQFPLGVVLDGARRRALADWVADGGLVIEDDYDAEHRYDRPPVAALRASLPDAVFYTGSVSKLLAPALRTGWLVVPRRFHDAIVDAKRNTDLGNAVLGQLALASLMASGTLEKHLRLQRARHRARRDAMIGAIRAELPGAVVHGAAAGLHLTVTFDDRDLDDLTLAAACLDLGVRVQPLSWHRQLAGPPGLVLGYAASSPSAIREGVSAIGRVRRSVGRPPLPTARLDASNRSDLA